MHASFVFSTPQFVLLCLASLPIVSFGCHFPRSQGPLVLPNMRLPSSADLLCSSLPLVFLLICSAKRPSKARRQTSHPVDWRRLISDESFKYSVRHYKQTPSETSTQSPENIPVHRDVLLEGDIIQYVPVYTHHHGQRFFNAVPHETQTWPRGIVPYTIDSSFDWPERELIQAAMSDIERRSCVRFIEYPTSTRYVYHKDVVKIEKEGRICSSFVGRMDIGEQELTLGSGCLKLMGEVQHELLHALGLYHEQSRMDRDEYVHIVWENILRGHDYDLSSQFEKYESNTFGLPYDYESIMHYGHNYFSRAAHLPTIVPRKTRSGQAAVKLGNREKMSDLDARKINMLYKCPDQPTNGETSSASKTNGRKRTRATTRPPRVTLPPVPAVTRDPCETRRCLSEEELYRLRKGKYPTDRWQLFKAAVKNNELEQASRMVWPEPDSPSSEQSRARRVRRRHHRKRTNETKKGTS